MIGRPADSTRTGFTREELDALRCMQAVWLSGIETVDPDDIETMAALTVLAGALIGFIPDLISEIERLRGEDGPRVRTVNARWARA